VIPLRCQSQKHPHAANDHLEPSNITA
jgi:hypothetical protein